MRATNGRPPRAVADADGVGTPAQRGEGVEPARSGGGGVGHDRDEALTRNTDPRRDPSWALMRPILTLIPAKRLAEETGLAVRTFKAARSGHSLPQGRNREALAWTVAALARERSRERGTTPRSTTSPPASPAATGRGGDRSGSRTVSGSTRHSSYPCQMLSFRSAWSAAGHRCCRHQARAWAVGVLSRRVDAHPETRECRPELCFPTLPVLRSPSACVGSTTTSVPPELSQCFGCVVDRLVTRSLRPQLEAAYMLIWCPGPLVMRLVQ